MSVVSRKDADVAWSCLQRAAEKGHAESELALSGWYLSKS